MGLDLKKFDHIILDGYGTLYGRDQTPLKGVERFLNIFGEKSILFSNIGSTTGSKLSEILERNFSQIPTRILTSMDLLIQYLKEQEISSAYHFGGEQAEYILNTNGIKINSSNDRIDCIIFTSLPDKNWIKKSQRVLQLINHGELKKIILANPDRLLPGPHVGINVGMMFDMFLRGWDQKSFKAKIVEIGKPNISREDLNLCPNSKVLVVGDNILTDGGLATNINAEFVLISDQSVKANFGYKLQSIEDFF